MTPATATPQTAAPAIDADQTAPTRAPAPQSLILAGNDGPATFRRNYNRVPFLLEHRLHEHPLVALPRLLELAQRMAKIPGHLYYDVGRKDVGRGWDLSDDRPFPAEEALERIETANAFMLLKGVQIEPAYGALLEDLLREIHELSGQPFGGSVTHTHRLTFILTSPGRVTTYHIDDDCNYLLQLSGTKTTYVFDGSDSSIVTAEELERFYSGDINAAKYKESSQSKAYTFAMKPGNGVHIPVTYPHWVQNDANVSVSASINFTFTDGRIGDVHRINHRLRKLGLHPRRPGASAVGDVAKQLAARATRALKRTQRS